MKLSDKPSELNFAKKALGMMSRFIIQNRLQKPEQILDFAENGYRYNEALSTADKPVFIR